MRLLGQADAILDEAKRLFSDESKFPFMFNLKDAIIIKGAFEKIYAWITVNLLKGYFIPRNSASTYKI